MKLIHNMIIKSEKFARNKDFGFLRWSQEGS